MKLLSLTLAIGLAFPASAGSQEAAQTMAVEADKKVEVSGVKDPALKPYRQMIRGVDAFDKFHTLAPQAELRFELVTLDGRTAEPGGLQLRIAGNSVSISVEIDEQATFALPRSQQALDENAELLLNRKKDQVRWRPRVLSPGVPGNARRLGDLRLECEVSWAVTKDDRPLAVRMAAAPFGGMCHAPMIGLFYRAPKRLASVTLVSGERKLALPLHDHGAGFLPPLKDKRWGDDSLIIYEFAEP